VSAKRFRIRHSVRFYESPTLSRLLHLFAPFLPFVSPRRPCRAAVSYKKRRLVFDRSGTKVLLWRAEGCHDEVVGAGFNASGEVWIVDTDFLGDPIQGLNEAPIMLVNTR
jgi:hypothetical protein